MPPTMKPGQQHRPVRVDGDAGSSARSRRRSARARRRAAGGSARAPTAGRRSAPRRTRRGSAAGSAARSGAARARGCSAGRASGRGTSRTSTPRSRTRSICAPTNAGRRKSARSIIDVCLHGLRMRRTRSAARRGDEAERRSALLDQPCWLPSISARIRQKRPPVSVTSPTGRGGCAPGRSTRAAASTDEHDGGDPDRDVDEEDPAPREPRREHAAGERPDRDRAPDRRAPDAERRAALRPWNSCESSASAVANMIAPPMPWTPRAMIRNSASFARPQSAEASVKRTIPIMKTRLRPKRSASGTRGQDARRERERVGVDHPLQVGERGVERPLDRGQGDVHDRDVEQEHERGDADRQQRPPLPRHPGNLHWTCAADPRRLERGRRRAGRDLRRRARRAAGAARCHVRLRGNQLTLEGDDSQVAEARAVIDELVELVEGGHADRLAHRRRRARHARGRPGRARGLRRGRLAAPRARRSRRRR